MAYNESPNTLAHGEWRPDKTGVQRWHPAPARPVVSLLAARVAMLRACPTCHARVDQLCRTKTGRHREPHATRLVPKRCACGSTLGHNKRLCEPCRVEARRAHWRRQRAKQRARKREAA